MQEASKITEAKSRRGGRPASDIRLAPFILLLPAVLLSNNCSSLELGAQGRISPCLHQRQNQISNFAGQFHGRDLGPLAPRQRLTETGGLLGPAGGGPSVPGNE